MDDRLIDRRRLVVGVGMYWLALGTGAGHVVRDWPKGKPAPELDLADLDGRRWNLRALRGKVAVINFWATWCEPCAAEMPSLSTLARERGSSDGVVVLGVNYQEREDKIRTFLERVPIAFPVLLDRDGAAALAWTPRVFPSTVLVDADGVPSKTIVGEFDWAGAEAERLLLPMIGARARRGASSKPIKTSP